MESSSDLGLQVLNWLYEYSVKKGFDSACNKIEWELRKREKIPDVPGSGYLLYMRQLQILISDGKWLEKRRLGKIITLLKDLLQFKPLHSCNTFYENLFHLYVATKLLFVSEDRLEASVVEEHISHLSWTEFKSNFHLKDDTYKMCFMRVTDAAKEAVVASLHGSHSKKTRKSLNRKLYHCTTQYVSENISDLLLKLLQLQPPTAIEKIINDQDMQNDLAGQNSQEYKILLNCIKNSITEKVVQEAVEALAVVKSNTSEDTDNIKSVKFDSSVDPNSQNFSDSVNEDMDIIQIDGKLWTVRKCADLPVNLLSEESTDDSQDELELPSTSYCRHENEIIIHNGKVWEVRPAKVMPVNPENALSEDSQSDLQFEGSRTTQADYEDVEIRELEELIVIVKRYTAKLEYKLKNMKDRRDAQRNRAPTPSDDDRGPFDAKPKGRNESERQSSLHTTPNQLNDPHSSNLGSLDGRQHTVEIPKANFLNVVSHSECSDLNLYVQLSSQEDISESLQLNRTLIKTKKIIPETPELSERQFHPKDPCIPQLNNTNKENMEPHKTPSFAKQTTFLQDCTQEISESADSDTTFYTLGEQSGPEDKPKYRPEKADDFCVAVGNYLCEDPTSERTLKAKVRNKRKMLDMEREMEDIADKDDLASRVKTSPRKQRSSQAECQGINITESPTRQQKSLKHYSKKRRISEEGIEAHKSEEPEDEDVFHTPMNSPECLTKQVKVCDEVEVSLSSKTNPVQSMDGPQIIPHGNTQLQACRVVLKSRYLVDKKYTIYS